MANSFLDKTGLTYLWGKIVALVNRKQDALTFDSTPTDNSTNPVTSGGVKAYVDANAGGGDSPVESGSGVGSVQTKAYTVGSSTFTQTASGQGAFAEGSYTQASGQYSHAEGYYTTAQGANQHVEGKFNVIDTSNKYAHITGTGTSATARKNGFTVDWQGNGVFAGTVMSKNNQRLVDSGECYDIVERAMERRIVQIGTSDDYGPGRRALEVGEETDWRPIFGDELGVNNPLGCSYLVYLRITQVYDETSGTSTETYIPLTKFITYSDGSATGGYTVKYIFGSNEYIFVDSGDYVIPESDFVPAT